MSPRPRPCLVVDVDPIDSLLLGDSRSTRAGQDHERFDQSLSPHTLFGALGAHLARRLGVQRGERDWNRAASVLGAFEPDLAKGSEERSELAGYALRSPRGSLAFPRPGHLVIEEEYGAWSVGGLLAPSEDAALSSLPLPRRLRAPWRRPGDDGPPEVEDEILVSETLLGAVLTADVGIFLAAGEPPAWPTEAFFQADPRVGVGMDNRHNRAAEGLLFGRPYRRFRSGNGDRGVESAGYRAWFRVLSLANGSPSRWNGEGFLGGDRRRVRLTFGDATEDPLTELRSRVLDRVASATTHGFLLYLLTPAVAPEAWPAVEGTDPLAAALGKPQVISGWSAAATHGWGPRPIRTLWPAGSVLFYRWPEGCASAEARQNLLTGLWCQPLDPAYRNAGFGRVLPGVW